MAIPKFYPEKRKNKYGDLIIKDVPIIMFYSFGSGRLQYYTGQRIDSKNYLDKYWTKGKHPVKSTAPGSANINNYLDILAYDVVNAHNQLRMQGLPVTAVALREYLDGKHKIKDVEEVQAHDLISYGQLIVDERKSGKRVVITGKRAGSVFKHNAIKNLQTTVSILNRFAEYHKIKQIAFEDVGKEWYSKFRSFVFDVEKKEVSTFSGHVKYIKMIMNEAKEDELHNESGYLSRAFVKPDYETDTIAISKDQMKQIEKLDLMDKPALSNVRDLFLVGCYSGLRFSDFSDLEVESIEKNFIRVKQQKTGDRVTIPVMKKMAKLLDRYDGGFPRPISNQKFNLYIKEVFDLAGLNHLIRVRKTTGGQESFDQVPFHKLISSHTARRSYATNMFKAGVPVMLIMAITGHKTESAFLRYIRATNEDKARMMAEMMKKLGL